jgi:hypothetical protein
LLAWWWIGASVDRDSARSSEMIIEPPTEIARGARPRTELLDAVQALGNHEGESQTRTSIDADDPWRKSITGTARVRSVSLSHQPLAHVELRALTETGIQLVGETDDGGTAIVKRSDIAGSVLYARHPDRATSSQLISRDVPEEITVSLTFGAVAKGRVRTCDGSALPAGIRVVAAGDYPGPPDCELLRALSSKDPRVTFDIADSQGRFEIHGLKWGQPIVIGAGGSGWASQGWVKSPRKEAGELAIVLEPLYGLTFHACEAGGRPLRSAFHWPESGSIKPLNRGADPSSGKPIKVSSVDDNLVVLAGLKDLDCSDKPGDGWRYFLTTSSVASELPLIQLKVSYRGYAPKEATASLQRLVDRIPIETVELEPVARGWGCLVVRMKLPEEWDLSGLQLKRTACTMHLSDGEGEKSLNIQSWTREPVRFPGIPFGKYSMEFHGGGSTRSASELGAASIEIGARDAEVTVDLRETCGFEVEVFDERGATYDGALAISVNDGTRGRVATADFERGPFRIFGIAPGDYEVLAVLAVKQSGDSPSCKTTATIKPHESAKLRMTYVSSSATH